MRPIGAGAVGGVLGGMAMSAAMLLGRRAGLLHKTLGEDSEDWLDRTFGTRRRVGEAGTFALEQANHLAASAGFGAAYAAARPWLRGLGPLGAGTLFGAALYAVNIAGIAPRLGITRGEFQAPPGVVAQRLGMHLLFGAVLGLATSALAGPPRAAAGRRPAIRTD